MTNASDPKERDPKERDPDEVDDAAAPSERARIAASLRPRTHLESAVDNVMDAVAQASRTAIGAVESAATSIQPAADAPPVEPAPAPTLQTPPAPPASAAAVPVSVGPARAGNVLEELRASVAMVVAGRFHAPAMGARVRRLFYPLSVLVALWNAMMANDELRRRYLRAMLPQVIFTIVAGVFWVFVINEARVNLDGLDIQTKGKNVTITEVAKGTEKAAMSLWAIVLALYATTSIFEWIVIALTREHHDAMSWHVATAVGVPPEERIDAPRVRLDVHWLVTKMKRRIQGGIILLVSGLPPAVLLLIVLVPFLAAIGDAFETIPVVESVLEVFANAVPNIVLAVIGAYWLGVFTLGKTAHAWRDEIVSDPFFLRAFDRWADRSPRLLGWLHLYARVLRRALGLVRRPAYVVEHARWEAAGFILLRIIISLPAVYLLLRPLIPVAATVVIAARSPDTLKGLPVSIVLEERGQ